jgi:hypothetical protein
MDDSVNEEQGQPKGKAVTPSSSSRRRLLKGGLGSAPVLLTLVSRPVLGGGGGGNQCFTPSGFVSMPTSKHGDQYTCLGRTPGFWKQSQKFDEWPAPYYPTTTKYHQATKFNAVFGKPSPYSDSMTFLQVLQTENVGYGGPPNNVARHAVAALLNIQKGWAPVLTKSLVLTMWRDYINTGGGTAGYFEPTAGVKWYQAEITEYLKSTMPV